MTDYRTTGNTGHGLKLLDRFWRFVEKTDSCWVWKGHLIKGYGQFAVAGKVIINAHIFSYVLLKKGIPHNLQLDHLCRNRACDGVCSVETEER